MEARSFTNPDDKLSLVVFFAPPNGATAFCAFLQNSSLSYGGVPAATRSRQQPKGGISAHLGRLQPKEPLHSTSLVLRGTGWELESIGILIKALKLSPCLGQASNTCFGSFSFKICMLGSLSVWGSPSTRTHRPTNHRSRLPAPPGIKGEAS